MEIRIIMARERKVTLEVLNDLRSDIVDCHGPCQPTIQASAFLPFLGQFDPTSIHRKWHACVKKLL